MAAGSLQNGRNAVCIDIGELLRAFHCIQLT